MAKLKNPAKSIPVPETAQPPAPKDHVNSSFERMEQMLNEDFSPAERWGTLIILALGQKQTGRSRWSRSNQNEQIDEQVGIWLGKAKAAGMLSALPGPHRGNNWIDPNKKIAKKDFEWSVYPSLGCQVLLKKPLAVTRQLTKAGSVPREWFKKPNGKLMPWNEVADWIAERWLPERSSRWSANGDLTVGGLNLLLASFSKRADAKEFHDALWASAMKESQKVWLTREGVANASEALAVRKVFAFMDHLHKKGAIPDEGKEVWEKVAAKKALLGDEEAAEGSEEFFTEREKGRHPMIQECLKSDDVEAYEALKELAGFKNPDSNNEALAVRESYSRDSAEFFLAPKAIAMGAWKIARIALDEGANPWVFAGHEEDEGVQGNPFAFFASRVNAAYSQVRYHWNSLTPEKKAQAEGAMKAGINLAARSYFQALVRDAQSMNPEAARELARQSLEQAKGLSGWTGGAEEAKAALSAIAEERELDMALAPEDGAQEAPELSQKKRLRM